MRCHQNTVIIIAVLFFSVGVVCAFFLPIVVLCVLLACLVIGGCLLTLNR